VRCASVRCMSTPYVLAFDLGGTDLKSAAVTADGEVIHFARVRSRVLESADAPFVVVGEMAERVRGAMGASPLAAGFGSPGTVDPSTGVLRARTMHLPHWTDLPLRARLEGVLGVRVVVDNDANFASLAEHRVGAAKGARVSLTVTVGTGVGCGIVIDGRVFHGAHGGAGELGHAALGGGAQECGCEVEGCIEQDAAGEGLVAAARAAGLEVAEAREVFALASSGDAGATALVGRLAHQLGRMIGVAVNLLDPDVVVVGGGLAQAGEALLEPVRASVMRHALESHTRALRIVPAALGNRAGVTGAGLAAWERASPA
jgi:glucokinase